MSRRLKVAITLRVIIFTLLAGVTAAAVFGVSIIDERLNAVTGESIEVSEHARKLHSSLQIVDLHADSLLWDRDLCARNHRGHVDFPRLQEGNVALQAFTIVSKVPRRSGYGRGFDQIGLLALMEGWPPSSWSSLKERVLYQARRLKEFAARSNGKFVLVGTAAELDDYLVRRKSDPTLVAGFLGVEGAHAIEGDLNNVDVFFDHGVRMMSPTHFFDNEVGGSSHGDKHGGLTLLGRQMIRKMQEKSMIVDLAHSSSATISDVLAISTKPVVVSHSGVRGTCDSVRNLSDEEISGIAETGGVVGIGYWNEAVCGKDSKAIARAIRYAVNIAGVDHVALGSDFDGACAAPFDSSGLRAVTQALIDEKFSDEEIRKIMGENSLRVLRAGLPVVSRAN